MFSVSPLSLAGSHLAPWGSSPSALRMPYLYHSFLHWLPVF